jgi:hypothetical protein
LSITNLIFKKKEKKEFIPQKNWSELKKFMFSNSCVRCIVLHRILLLWLGPLVSTINLGKIVVNTEIRY